jgi:hypothetical protein
MVRLLQAQGIAATEILGAESCVPLLGVNRAVEVNCGTAGSRSLYGWLNQCDVLIKADLQEPLVILRMSLAAQIAKGTMP